MLMDDFKRIIAAFADTDADIDFTQGTLLVQIRDEVIRATLTQRAGELKVQEHGQEELSASSWIINRIARISLLADRILSYVAEPDHFVVPSALLVDHPDFSTQFEEVHEPDAVKCMLRLLERRAAGSSSVTYLTSDAGEGKTTLISKLARMQAEKYKNKKTDWLLVPIPLGARTFLRFDDVVVAALVNRLRFQLFYYDAFLELVRLGVIVPAFDGFEEMIIESSPGEAISALGNLVRNLRSAGTVLISARKAFFDYQSLKTQAKLFDAIGSDAVAFSRIAIERWSKDQFIRYAVSRGMPDPSGTFDSIAQRLGDMHPLVTRAVLIKRLVDVSLQSPSMESLLKGFGHSPQDYFFQFVTTIIEREAFEKWLDQSGDPPQPLLTVEEHHELLAMIAQELWFTSSDALRPEVVSTLGDMFCESRGKPPAVARQVRERLKQHPLLVSTSVPYSGLSFDHEDFRTFYIGEALGIALLSGDPSDLRMMLRVGTLPRQSVDEALLFLTRKGGDRQAIIAALQQLSNLELPTSFARENSGQIMMDLIDKQGVRDIVLSRVNFPGESLLAREFSSMEFQECYFLPSSLAGSKIVGCRFKKCSFERLELGTATDADFSGTVLEDCRVSSLLLIDHDDHIFEPEQISAHLSARGFQVVSSTGQKTLSFMREPDENIRLISRTLRTFLRATQVNENVIRMRLGAKGSYFVENVLPDLLRVGLLEEVKYLGSGVQRRFRLGFPMQQVQEALESSKGMYSDFISKMEASGA